MNNLESGCIHEIEGMHFDNLDKKVQPTEKEQVFNNYEELAEKWKTETDPENKAKLTNQLVELISGKFGMNFAKMKREELKVETSSNN